jgi:UDP-N-acetylmuramoylalanine--D-glutamate ligase
MRTVMTLTASNPVLQGLRVLVIGLGRSGIAAASLAFSKGADVLAVDRRSLADLPEGARALKESGVRVRTGDHPASLAQGIDLAVVSPGVPGDIPLLASCRTLGIPVWGEVELASRYCHGRVIGITGSNGKSTTTTMAGTILRTAGIPGGTGGNLDIPLTELLTEDSPGAVHAVELSSFQLETVQRFRPAVAVVVNLTPDHLDRYESFDDYARAKARILEVQGEDDHAVLNADDPETGRFEPLVQGGSYRFSTRAEVDRGAFLRAGSLVLRTDHGEEEILPAESLPVPGEHNIANALAAALACRLCGCPPEGIAAGLEAFRPLPHRLERIGEVRSVSFYNDSKATNLDATERAVRSFEPGTVHLILGGKDKGGDWASLAPLVERYARRVLLVGQASAAILAGLEGTVPMLECETVPNAVRHALASARAGDVVLLSPACASFDQYRNFEERGEDFQRAVFSLMREEAGDA